MPWLDPRVRCQACGEILTDGDQVYCPCCHAELADAGASSELQQWGRVREQGRGRFVLRVLLRYGLYVAILCAVLVWRGVVDPVDYAFAFSWLILGYVMGRLYWRGAEREYAASAGQEELITQTDRQPDR